MITLILAALFAQEPAIQEFGNVRFVPPKDWKREAFQTSVKLTPPDVPKDRQCMVLLLPGEELKGTLREWFDTAWKSFAGESKVTGGEVESKKGEGFDIVARSAVLEREGGGLCVALMAFNPGTRVESLFFYTDGRDLYDKHIEAVSRMAAGIRFANLKPAEVGLEGAWMRGAWKADFGAGAGATKFEIDHVFFYKGGLACRRWNSEGQDGLDTAREMAASDPKWGWWGTRTEKDGVITVKWQNGGETVYQRKDDNLQAGSGQPFLKLASVDTLKLDGVYRYGDGKPAPSGGTDFDIKFTPDGRFEEAGVCPATMREGPKSGAGKYSIRNYTLFLEYDSGVKVRMGFYALGKPDSRMESVYLNTFIFSRAK